MELRRRVGWPRWLGNRGRFAAGPAPADAAPVSVESGALHPGDAQMTRDPTPGAVQAPTGQESGENPPVDPSSAGRDPSEQELDSDEVLLDGPLYRRSPQDPRPLVPQPVIAMRARSHLRMITSGLVFAIVGAICVVLSSVTMLRLTDTSPILPAVGNLGAVGNALVALMQWRLWRLALKEWEGLKDVDLHAWLGVSASGTWLAVAGALAVPASSWVMLDVSARSETSWWLALIGTICVIVGTALAGVHRFHPGGPSGVPAHIRRNHDQHAARRGVPTVRDSR